MVRLIIFSLLLAWCFERVHMIISASNYGTPFNGFGAIDSVNQKTAKLPMAYRVLMPWIVRLFEKSLKIKRIAIYQGAKLLMTAWAFFAVGFTWGIGVEMLTAILLLLTIQFDYWDWSMELAGIALAVSGHLPLAIVGGMLHALSKETALIVPVAYFLKTYDYIGAMVLLGFLLIAYLVPRVMIGPREMYCDLVQVRHNLKLFKHFLQKEFWTFGQWYHFPVFISVALTIGIVIAAIQTKEWTALIPLMMLGAGWTFAKADETRVFSACLPWLAAYVIGGM